MGAICRPAYAITQNLRVIEQRMGGRGCAAEINDPDARGAGADLLRQAGVQVNALIGNALSIRSP